MALIAVVLALVTGPAAAATVSARSEWAAVVAPVLNAASAQGALSPALADLHGIGLDTSAGLNTLGPLLEVMPEALSLGAFRGLDPVQQRHILETAAHDASYRDWFLVSQMAEDLEIGVDPKALPLLYETSDALLASHGPWLGEEGRRRLEAMRPALLEAIIRSKSLIISDLVSQTAKHLTPNLLDRPEPSSGVPVRIIRRPEASGPIALPRPAPLVSPQIQAARESRRALGETRSLFLARLTKAAEAKDAEAFWTAADAAVAHLAKGLRAEGLDDIAKRPVSDYGTAVIESAKDQARALTAEIAALARDHGVELVGWRLLDERRALSDAIDRAQDRMYHAGEPLRHRAVDAARRLARPMRSSAGALADIDRIAAYHEWRLKATLADPDRNAYPVARDDVRKGQVFMPGTVALAALQDKHSTAGRSSLLRQGTAGALAAGGFALLSAASASAFPSVLAIASLLWAVRSFLRLRKFRKRGEQLTAWRGL